MFHNSFQFFNSGEPVGNVLSASGIADQIEVWERNDLVFKILSKDGLRITSSFSINSRSGEIFTNAMIDREQVNDRNYFLEIMLCHFIISYRQIELITDY